MGGKYVLKGGLGAAKLTKKVLTSSSKTIKKPEVKDVLDDNIKNNKNVKKSKTVDIKKSSKVSRYMRIVNVIKKKLAKRMGPKMAG